MTAAATDLRTALGAAVTDRDAVRVASPDAIAYLQGQLSQDVDGLAVGASAATFVLDPTGKLGTWGRLTRVEDDAVVLDVDGGHGAALVARLRRFLLRTKAEVDPLDGWRAVAVRGPGASAAGAEAASPGVLVAPAGWPGVEGVDLLGPDAVPPAGVPAAVASDLASLRIRCGVPALGAELVEGTIPAEAGQWVVAASVSFTKDCFTGQELVARIDSRGGHVPRHLRGLDIPGPAAPTPGDPVAVGGKEVGHVTSVAPRPGGGTVALAVIGRAVEPPAAAEVGPPGGGVAATVVELPFGT